MGIYRKIDTIKDIKSAAFVVNGEASTSVIDFVRINLDCQFNIIHYSDEVVGDIIAKHVDIVFICDGGSNSHQKGFDICQKLRDLEYKAIIVLVTNEIIEHGGSSNITSMGFDNYILRSDSWHRIADSIQLAIINRKRRSKFTIQYDENPDALCTVDRDGKVYDLNRVASEGSRYKPKDVVIKGINICELETMKFFPRIVKPLITKENTGRVFSPTCNEGDKVFQLQIKIHEVCTIGIVATIVKIDITRTMFTHTMDILFHSVDLLSKRDSYTASHSARVYYYCKLIAEKLAISRKKKVVRDLYFAALTHDIGKIGIRDNILLKQGKLSGAEFRELATHPVKGYRMLQRYPFLHDAGELVRFHHERPDGKGYPDKLVGKKIPIGASIIALADSFDAMTTSRPYRSQLSFEKAVSEIRENLGTQFDVEAGNSFLSIITYSLVEEIEDMSRKPLKLLSHELIETLI